MSDITIAGATYNDVPSILVPKVGGGFAEYTEGEVTQAEFDALKDAFTANLIHDTATGAIANFPDGAALPVRDLSVDIEPVQAGSGDPSPDNVRPISGWTGGNIHVSPTTDAEDGTTYSITFPAEAGTVYGGTLDVTQGKLTVDKVAVTIDGNNIKLDRVTSYGTLNRFGTVYPSGLSAKYTGNTTYCIADKLTPSYNNTIAINYDRPEGYYCFPHSSAFFVSMPSSTITSIAEANAWAGDNTPKVVYELATPIVYDLTPTEVSTLLGTNNVWADTGETTVDYYADPTLYINRKIAAAVAAMS